MSLFNDMLDNAVSKGIDTAENKLLGEEDKTKRHQLVVLFYVWLFLLFGL
jgi:hypothetical protein